LEGILFMIKSSITIVLLYRKLKFFSLQVYAALFIQIMAVVLFILFELFFEKTRVIKRNGEQYSYSMGTGDILRQFMQTTY